jgi:NodT family efflux transporter outer membrane factor (OMF) lipoprotein
MANSPESRVARHLVVTTVLLCAAGCVVGPNFEKPAPPPVSGYTPERSVATSSAPTVEGGNAQTLVEGRDIPGDWWTLFHSTPLDDLIERSLHANPDLKAAQAALTVARENVLAQRGAYYPSVTAGVSASRSKTSDVVSPTPASGALTFSLYTPQVSVGFVPDVFGLNRRTVESLGAQAQQARFALVATHIALSANVATAVIQEASLRAQVTATRELIAINTDMVRVLRTQYARGYVSRLDVAAQEAQLAQTAAALPPLLKQLLQQRDVLARLAGGFPSEALAEDIELSSLRLPADLPLSLPSQLVAQRPDVRQAEENLHAASAQVGVAIANRLPSFPLTADAGSTALALGALFGAGTGFWDLGAAVAQPIFQGGTLRHRERAAKAAFVVANEQYRSTVLTAFQNVADSLYALQQDADALKTAASAAESALVTLDLARKQYQAGYAGYLALLNAEQAYQQAVISLAQARANRFADSAALFQALGGGWWNRADIPRN